MTSLMSAREYARMRDAEDGHWWYGALRSLVAHELERARPGRLLDAGCGTGGGLARWRRVLGRSGWGIDLSSDALRYCRGRGERLIARAGVEALPFESAAFDAVVSLDVLCLEGVDERRALGEIRRVLRPGGVIFLNMPAFEVLRGEHDVAVKVGRRYTAGRLRRLLEESGFEVRRARYWNACLFPVALVVRRLRRGAGAATSDLDPLPGPLNAALGLLLRVEHALPPLPWGTSVLAIATKR